MEGAIFFIALLAVVIMAWACWDKVIFHGPAFVYIDDTQPHHISATCKAVRVVPSTTLTPYDKPLIGIVSNAKAADIAAEEGFAKRQVTVSKRLFGKLRVTRIAHA